MEDKKLTFTVAFDDANLEHIFQQYISSIKDQMDEGQVEALRGTFFSGASAVLHVFDQMTANAIHEDDNLQQLLDAGYAEDSAEVEQANEALDEAADMVQVAMTRMMNDVCAAFNIENTSYVCHSGFDPDVKLVTQSEQASPVVGVDFDLETWTPDEGAN